MASIFDRLHLTPGQLRTVAERRFDDAEYLRKSTLNKHANGVYYLGGFVLECLLKAKLLERHPWLQHPPGDRSKWSRGERHLFDLCYRRHDLAGILKALRELLSDLAKADPTGKFRDRLVGLCDQWTVFARYSPHTAKMKDAEGFLDRIKDLKPWLK